MSEIVGIDTWQGKLTRIYVWYPTQESGKDWANDPAIQHALREIWERPVPEGDDVDWVTMDGNPYYWHKYATGCVWVICRVFYRDTNDGESSISFPESSNFPRRRV